MIKQKITVRTSKGNVRVTMKVFEELLDSGKITKIDYNNILAELIFFPHVLNMVGILKVEAENETADQKVAFYRWKAKQEIDFKSRNAKASIKDIENNILIHDEYPVRRKLYDGAKRRQGLMENLYWSATEKLRNLKTISDKIDGKELIIDPEDIESNLEKMYGILIES